MKYRSKFEAKLAKQLPHAAYEPIKIAFTQPAKKRKYTPDWVLPSGIILEAKGRLDAADRDKMLWIKAEHPHLDIRFIFQNASNPIRRGSKTTYAMWADKHGFPWADRDVPQSWLCERKGVL